MNDGQPENIERKIGEMHKRREKMADGRRFLIYYTFENEKMDVDLNEIKMLENETRNSAAEKKI